MSLEWWVYCQGIAMTEEEWLSSTDSTRMLSYLAGTRRARKHQLFYTARDFAWYRALGQLMSKQGYLVRWLLADSKDTEWESARAECRLDEANLLRDIFGNSFRPVAVDAGWLTPTVQSIAYAIDESATDQSAIYRESVFDRLPILADALEEAGCTNAVVLLHCRQPGEHVRGCWVVDLVLGKE